MANETDPNQRPFDRDKLRDLTEKIQVGDAEEGAQALEELIDHAWDRGRANVRQEVEADRLERQWREENVAALSGFAKKWPSLATDDTLSDAATGVLRKEFVTDLKAAGASDAELAPIAHDVGRLAAVHGYARVRGAKVRSPEDLLNAAGQVLGNKFNIKPARRSPEEYVRDMRAERGFRRDGTHRLDHELPASSDRTREAASRYVQDLRKARGFAPRSDR
jgi:hypothetical protein